VAVYSRTDLRLDPLFAAAAQASSVFVRVAPQLTADEFGSVLRATQPRPLASDADRLTSTAQVDGIRPALSSFRWDDERSSTRLPQRRSSIGQR
jgi:hypothetical protein